MIEWNKRPLEVKSLLNPAFIGKLLREFINEYSKERKDGVPFELIFLFIPLVLQKTFRDSLPKSTRTQLHIWLQEYPEFLIEYDKKVQNLIPYVKESTIILLNERKIDINKDGKLIIGGENFKRKKTESTSEIEQIIKKAKFMGKWLARSGSSATIYTLWGIKL
jgi:hypothetical protein